AKIKKRIGKGSPYALSALDASGNASAVGALIPTLALAIPGSATLAILMSAMAAQGVFPGPSLLRSVPGLLETVGVSIMVSTLMLAIFGYLIITPSALIQRAKESYVLVASVLLLVVGIYAIRWSMFEVWVSLVVGIVGYVLERH